MALTPGTRLGVYEVTAQIGAGGMGQVYRATDSNLRRSVAIKVLPASVAADLDRLARFQREAEVLAALNHPNIAAIYGLEKTPDLTALVMELVDGEDLSQRLARGAIPIDEALPIAKQIAEALEAAHDQGIIHRDLKPANVKVRPDGTVKVLDFGLAKAMERGSGIGDQGSGAAANSPTITSPAMTQAGMILGTAAYMSPEQAKGRNVDKRCDVWAFGAVLYEMLTGRRAFAGDDITDTIVSVMTKEADWASLPSATPLPVRTLLRRCLDKDPKRRLRDIGEARLALEAGNDPAPASVSQVHQRQSPFVWALAVIAVLSLAGSAVALWQRPAAVEKTSARLTITLPPGAEITSYPAITRDGRTVAYVTQQGTEDSQLYLRDLNSFEARAVVGSGGAKQPFFSPDGKWVAFFAQGQLLKAEVGGGAPIRMAEANYSLGGTWNDDNSIIYISTLRSGLLRISASGGTPETLTKPDGAGQGYAHVFPQALPGGRRVLFTIWGQTQGSAMLSLDSGKWEMVLPSSAFSSAVFDPAGGSTGRLLVIDPTAGMRAAPFDPAHAAPTSADASVLSNVFSDVELETPPWLAVSNAGTAVYAPGNAGKSSLVWVDREGKIESLGKEQDAYREMSISPDGTKAVVRHRLDLWIYDLQRGTRSPLTSGSTSNFLPLWSNDGLRIVFASNRGGDWDIYSQPADISQPAEVLLKRSYDQWPNSVLPDKTVLFTETHPSTARDLWIVSPDGKTSPVRVTPFQEMTGQFAPRPAGGSHRIAYSSDESGRYEIYVQSLAGGPNRVPISNEGGTLPTWSRDGKELYYVTGDALVVAAARPDGSFGAPSKLFDRSNFLLNYRYRSYDVSPDGKRFLMIQRDPASVPRQLNVILNWPEELKLVGPTK